MRALELYRLDRLGLAIREWAALVRGLSADERYVAIAFALDAGWHDRGVFTIGDAPDALRPQSVAWACLGVCLATYERWLREEDADLTALLDESFRRTGAVFGGDRG